MRRTLIFTLYILLIIQFNWSATLSRTPIEIVPDWENNHILQINREPARAAFIGFGNAVGDRNITLNGSWKFRWSSGRIVPTSPE